uniref:Tetraspanin-15 n=1 Tax=Ficedula albicollis TaxID=59894 RepID=A0A803VJD4_FICAL
MKIRGNQKKFQSPAWFGGFLRGNPGWKIPFPAPAARRNPLRARSLSRVKAASLCPCRAEIGQVQIPAAIPAGNEPGRAAGMARTCRDSHFYYYGVKFALSAYATLFSMLGLLILGVGIYAEAERQRHRTLEGIFLAPAVLLLLLGITVFLVSFVGMLGSLRDNRTLLRTFFWVLLLIFLTELLLILMEIIFESKMNEVFHSNIQEGIRHYYDDLDFKNILDFVQEKFSCCGGDEFRDWEVNQYHACNGSGALACGVPHSCCVRGAPGGVVNTLCGYRALDKQRLELIGTIHVRGCIHAVGLWLKDNFQATLAIVCSLLLPQILHSKIFLLCMHICESFLSNPCFSQHPFPVGSYSLCPVSPSLIPNPSPALLEPLQALECAGSSPCN